MRYERFAWAGTVIMAFVSIYLSYKPIAHDLSKGLVIGLAALILFAVLLMFPWRIGRGGLPVRMIDKITDSFRAEAKGGGNNTQIARDHANQTMFSTRTNCKPNE
ncbi:hypothetical protein [Mycobacterium marinum]|uniref:hypothetical protein n=1 Tax=Mycobacterium marinum TaxID=1781 RepID=UPI003566EB0A